MALLTDTDTVATRFAPYVEELHEFYASHGMHFGDVQDLQEFSRRLEAPGPFSSELSSMVRSVIFRERGSVPRSDLLALVAVSIAGPGVGKATGEVSEPVSQLTDFIAGVVRAPRNEPGPAPATEFASAKDEFASSEEHADSGTASQVEDERSSVQAVGREEENHQPDAYLTSDLQEALKRIETTSLEFRLYLDSIEERVRRIEPRELPPVESQRLDNVATAESYGVPVANTHVPDEMHAVDEARAVVPFEEVRAGETGEKPLLGYPDSQKELHLVSEVKERVPKGEDEGEGDDPWFRLRSAKAKRWYAGMGSFFVLLTGFLIWQSPIVHQGTAMPDHLDATIFNTFGRGGTAAKPTPYGQNVNKAGQILGRAGANGKLTSPRTATNAATSTPAGGDASNTQDEGSTPANIGALNAEEEGPATSDPASADSRRAPANEEDATIAYPLDQQGKRGRASHAKPNAPGRLGQSSLAVSSGVMAGNLIFAPPPAYPKLASLTHVQGQVLLQAVVSRTGKVANLRVVRGPRLLRGAATNAVYKWRYRPYTVNGHAVDVATIVSVEFVLHH